MVYYIITHIVKGIKMEFLQLRYFCDAARSENFTVTAKKFGVPPSTVSQSIHRLEKGLGVDLFSRQANSIKLSGEGKAFFLKASAALALIDDAVACISSDRQKRTLSICIDARRQRMLRVIENFKKQYPDINVKIKHGFDLSKEAYDIIVADYSLQYPDYDRRLIVSEALAIAINKSNPLALRKKLTVDMLKNEPFIAMSEKRPMHKIVVDICADFGFSPHITLQSDDPSYVSRLVSLGMGVAIVPEFYSSDEFPDNVALYPTSGYTRDTYAYILQSKSALPYIQDFLKLLIEK